MPRNLSAVLKSALHAPETAEVVLSLLTISHPSISPPIRVVNNLTAVTSRGNSFVAFPFELALPDELEDRLARVSLSIDNVDRQIVNAVRTITSPPTVLLELVLPSAPDTVEADFTFTLRDVEWNESTVTGQLYYRNLLTRAFPAGRFTPARFPSIFG